MSAASKDSVNEVDGNLKIAGIYSAEPFPGTEGMPSVQILHQGETIFSRDMPKESCYEN
jgi:hypothetical protein